MSSGTASQEMWLSKMMQSSFQHGNSMPEPVVIAITICLSVLALVGTFGNILVVIFFYRGLRDLPQNVYVIALATLDTTVCAIVIPSTIYQDVWRGATTDLMCKGFHILRCSLVTSSAFLLCLIAVDRFAIICFVPGIQTGRRKSVRLIGLTLMLGFAIGTPLGLTTGTRKTLKVRMADKVHTSTINLAHCISDYSILPSKGVKIYKICLTALFLCLLLAIVFFYANIFYFVRRRQRRWDKSRSYVTRVAGEVDGEGEAKDSKGEEARTGKEATGCSGVNKEVGVSVRFKLNSEATKVARGVLETDIDQILSEASVAPSNLGGDNNAAESEDGAADQGGGACAGDAIPMEQRRMLGGQRRGDSVTSNRLAKAQRHMSERSRKRPHIKTAKVLSIITFFYLLSYLPFFLVFLLMDTGDGGGGLGSGGGRGRIGSPILSTAQFNAMNISWIYHREVRFTNLTYPEERNQSARGGLGAAGQSNSNWLRAGGGGKQTGLGSLFMQTVYYFYFINHGVNPIVYGCMNAYFKQQVYSMYNSIRMSCRCRRS